MPEIITQFSTDQSDPSSYPINQKVGRIYEVGINGVGYMLADLQGGHPDIKYLRKVIPLDPQRFLTGETPFKEALERYVFTTYFDWTGGTGQKYLHRPASSDEAFFDSDSVNPFESGKLTLLKQVQNTVNSTANPCRATVASDTLIVQDGPKAFKGQTTPNTAGTSFNVAAATTVTDLDSDGLNWYAAGGTAGIFKGTGSSDPGAAWSPVQASIARWAANRICCAYKGTGSSTNNVFTSLNQSGIEEQVNGRMILPPGWEITDITSGNGFVFFAAYSGDHGVVYAWQIGSDAPKVAYETETGELPRAIFYYQGNVMMRTETLAGTQSVAKIWRTAVGSSGDLTPFLLATLDTPATTLHGPGTFGALGKFVFFSWTNMDVAGTTPGIGCINLASGGYCKWLKASSVATGALVRSITAWRGRLIFTVDGIGAYIEHATQYCTTGVLYSSVSDKASVLNKIIDSFTMQGLPMPDTASVGLSWSMDEGASYTDLGTPLTGTGARRIVTLFGKKGSSITTKLTLNAGTGNLTTPTMTLLSVRLHQHDIADMQIQLPINCADTIQSITGAALLKDSGPGRGALRARYLESLVQTRVLLQDIDWVTTKETNIYEVTGVDLQSQAQRGGSQKVIRTAQVAIVTLRRVLK